MNDRTSTLRISTHQGAQNSTDYTRSYTARSFVPHYTQRISSACVMHGAAGIIHCLGQLRTERLGARAAGRGSA